MKHNKNRIQQSLIGSLALSDHLPEIISHPGKWHRLLLILGCQIWFLHLDAQNFGIRNRIPTPNDSLVSFVVNNDGSATFRLYAPDAKSVELGGDLKAEKIERANNGVWTMSTGPNINPSAYRYVFKVDGMNVIDPKNPMAADFRPMVELVPKSESLFWQKKDVPHGLMSIVYYESKATNSTRRMFVWTPPRYFSNDKKIPVLYLMHGGGDNDTNWPGQGKAGWILDNLFAEGKITQMIVVMPDGSIPVEIFAHDLGSNIIPFIEANFRVLADAPHRAIAGLSMGGIQLLETLVDYPDMFAYVNVMSSGWFTRNPESLEKYDQRVKAVAPILKKNIKYFIFTTGGKADMASNNTPPTQAIFTKYGIKSEFSEMDGGHTMYVWRHDLYNFTTKIFK
ncbi:MAG: alpha/beta hydrolase-fold protein [Bacteroidota bacterium]|nr:alpha/beta hydrolase-fold protein [Bacteroidota bacterium]MDP4289453.1 alpha/beta hydrolase-fold protein [Bacteroidota bacterium]